MDMQERLKELAAMDYWSSGEIRKLILAAVNYDESKVISYPIPSPLDRPDGSRVKTPSEWVLERRPAILKMFKDEMYGEIPPRPDITEYETLSVKENALDGTATRKEIRIHLAMHNGKKHSMDMLLYVPKAAKKPVPAFLGLCFRGNHSASDEPDVMKTGVNYLEPEFLDDANRGNQSHRWHFRELMKAGYAGATICYHDIFPDRKIAWEKSIYSLFGDFTGFSGAHEKYSSIGAWAWGLSRALDCLENEPLIDASRVAVHGHSRLGKTALWAGACDTRFKIVISNDSGCGGASLAKRYFGESYLFIVNAMPHWFIKGFRKYIVNEEAMPYDQNFLIALQAPRPVAVASATEDLWADPRGEFLSAWHAGEVYRLFGSDSTLGSEMPPPDTLLTGDVSYHIRTGIHDQTPFDWSHYIQIADRYWKNGAR